MKHFGFWFLEPEPLYGFWIAKVRWTEIYQSYLKNKKNLKKVILKYFK